MRLAAFHGWPPAAWLVFALTVLGLILRVIAARDMPLYIDEGNTLLGAHGVLAHGLPLLPSGAIYLHGATISYLLAPLAAVGWAEFNNIGALRALPALVGTAVIPMTAILAARITVSSWVAVAAAALMAIDPLSIHWSAYVRMYPFLQVTTVGTALCVVILMRSMPDSAESSRAGRWLVALLWLGVITHLSAALLLPVIALLAVARWGLALPRSNPNLMRALAWGSLAPVAQIGVSSAFGNTGTRDATERALLPSVSFLGDHRIDPSRFLSPEFGRWLATFPGDYFGLAPALVIIAASLIVAFTIASSNRDKAWPRVTLLALYWLPVLALVLVTTADSPRYFAFLQPLAVIILAVAGGDLVSVARQWRNPVAQPLAFAGIAIAMAIVLVRDAQAISTATQWGPLAIGDQRAALARIAQEWRPGELIINQTPVLTYLALGDLAETRFLNRHDQPNEYVRYTRFLRDGQSVDYWLGQPTIGTMSDLCRAFADHPGSFVMLAEVALAPEFRAGWYGEMIDTIDAATTPEFSADRVVLLRSLPLKQWEKPAISHCAAAGVEVRKERQQQRREDRQASQEAEEDSATSTSGPDQ